MSLVFTNDSLPGTLPGFDQPMAMLRACHDRMTAHCERLEKLLEHLQSNGCDAQARKATGQIVRYFSTSARQHHQDEEEDLFPLLNRQSLKLADMIHSLRKDHDEIEALWQALETVLKGLREDTDLSALQVMSDEFCDRTRAHIQHENTDFLPLAENSLSKQQWKDIGRSMAERRGVRADF